MNSLIMDPENRYPIGEDILLAIWIMTLIGLLLSTTICAFVIYTIFLNKNLVSIFFKVIRLAITYGFMSSLLWTINLTIGYIVIDRIDKNHLNIMCYILNPLKIFCQLQWFIWNGLILFLLMEGIKNTKFDLEKLSQFIDKIFHPLVILFSLLIALLPFYKTQSYSTQQNSKYFKYICQYHTQADDNLSEILFFTINLLPMWLIVFYTLYIYVDVYVTFTKLRLTMPNDYWRMMYQPLIISITWIWPTVKFFIQISGGNSPFFFRAMFIVQFISQIEITQGFTICFQSLIYLNQIKKFLIFKQNQQSKDQIKLNETLNNSMESYGQQSQDSDYLYTHQTNDESLTSFLD